MFRCCRAFRGFRDHFPEQAEALLQSLEPTYRRALQGELCLSSSSSSGSIAQTTGFKTSRPYKPAVTPQSATGMKRSNKAADYLMKLAVYETFIFASSYNESNIQARGVNTGLVS